jgi:hypothetical protein
VLLCWRDCKTLQLPRPPVRNLGRVRPFHSRMSLASVALHCMDTAWRALHADCHTQPVAHLRARANQSTIHGVTLQSSVGGKAATNTTWVLTVWRAAQVRSEPRGAHQRSRVIHVQWLYRDCVGTPNACATHVTALGGRTIAFPVRRDGVAHALCPFSSLACGILVVHIKVHPLESIIVQHWHRFHKIARLQHASNLRSPAYSNFAQHHSHT